MIRRIDSNPGVVPLVKADEPEKPRRSPSPARNPASKIVHIRNLVRPFTVNQLKELAKRTGPIVDEEFWIDKIKSHCFIIVSSSHSHSCILGTEFGYLTLVPHNHHFWPLLKKSPVNRLPDDKFFTLLN